MRLNNDQLMIRDMARKFAQERLLPGAEERDHSSKFPAEEIRELGKLGMMGMLVPEEFDGANTDYLSLVVAIEEIAAADGAISTIVSVQNSLVNTILLRYAEKEMKEHYLTPMARGEKLGCFCLSEPHAGSDPAALTTRARSDGDEYIINGTKQFVTSGQSADVAIVFAVTLPDAGKSGMSAFLVPTDTPGYTIMAVEKKMGQRCSDTAQIAFDNCRVPKSHMLGVEGLGYKIALSNLESGRLGIAAQSIGMARAAYEAAVSYACERKTFGATIIHHQAVAFRLSDMATQIEAARQLLWHAAALKDSGEPCLKEACMAKLMASETAERVCHDAIQIFGGYGYTQDYPVERIYRDVRVCSIYEGTSDIQKLIISRKIEEEGC